MPGAISYCKEYFIIILTDPVKITTYNIPWLKYYEMFLKTIFKIFVKFVIFKKFLEQYVTDRFHGRVQTLPHLIWSAGSM